MKVYISIVGCLVIGNIALKAQQESAYSQYMFNLFLYNPAIAGSDGSTTVNFTGREQWLGWEGTPRTHSISAQTRVLKNSFIARALNLRKKI